MVAVLVVHTYRIHQSIGREEPETAAAKLQIADGVTSVFPFMDSPNLLGITTQAKTGIEDGQLLW